MDRDQAIAKIKKCLALGRSSNEHEAAAAMRQAQKLMEQFGVGTTDIELAEVNEAATRSFMGKTVSWEVELANLVAAAFGCETLTVVGYLPGQSLFKAPARRRVFVGVGPAAEVATYTFDVLGRQCSNARRAHVAQQSRNCKQFTKTARGDRFALYWVFAVRQLVQAFAGSERRTELLQAYLQRQYPDAATVNVKCRSIGRNVRSEDSWAGAEAGRKARLEHGVGHEPMKAIAR